MATIAVQPFVLKDFILSVATDDYQTNVSSVLFEPSSQTVTWQGGTPSASFTDTTVPTWTCTIEYAQDWTTANSFAQYLLANVGLKKTVVFKPLGATTGKPVFTVDLFIVPGPIGGGINTVQTGSVTLGCAAAPVKSTAP